MWVPSSKKWGCCSSAGSRGGDGVVLSVLIQKEISTWRAEPRAKAEARRGHCSLYLVRVYGGSGG